MASSTESSAVFEGWLSRINPRRRSDKQWCVLDGELLAFYRNQRSSCQYCIELCKIQSVTASPNSDTEHRFEIKTSDKKYLFGTDTQELCDEWIKHVISAIQQGSKCVINGAEEKPLVANIRRGSQPQQNVVKDAIKRHSSKYGNPDSSKVELTLSIQNRTSSLVMDNTVPSSNAKVVSGDNDTVNRRPTSSGSKVKDLVSRFSQDSPVSPPIKSPTSPKMSPFQKVRQYEAMNEENISSHNMKHVDQTDINKINSDNVEEKRPDSGYSTLPDIAEPSPEDKVLPENFPENNQKEDEKGDEEKIIPTIVRNDNVQIEVTNNEAMVDNDSKGEIVSPVNSNCVETESSQEEPVVMRRKTFSPANPETVPDVCRAEDDDEDTTDGTDNGGDSTSIDDLLNLKFEDFDETLPHKNIQTSQSLTSLKGMLLKIGGTELQGTFVKKEIDVYDLENVHQLSNLIQTLNE